MANINPSANMSLPIPGVGQESGPQWATDLNSCLTIIDGHSHDPGSGVQITPSGLNINADLPMGINDLTEVRSVRLNQNSVALPAASPDLTCIYAAPNGGTGLYDLFYNDGAGNQIAITKNGAITGSAGSISGLVSPASASYVGSTFVWQSAVNTPANLDAGYIILRNNSANSKGLTLQPPLAMAADYSITLPVLPGVKSVLSLDTSGNIASLTLGSSLQLVSSTLSVTPIRSQLTLTQGNGHGSSSTRIRRFVTPLINTGTDITYVDSATLGTYITIVASGLYTVSVQDDYIAGGALIGLSLNATVPEQAQSIQVVANSRVLCAVLAPGSGGGAQCGLASWTGYLTAGDIVRAHDDGQPNDEAFCRFNITKIGV